MARGPIPNKPVSRPTVPVVRDAASAYYRLPGNSVGGSLHVALDDGNLDDDVLHYCRKYALERGDAVGACIAAQLLEMTRTQRTKVYMTMDRGY